MALAGPVKLDDFGKIEPHPGYAKRVKAHANKTPKRPLSPEPLQSGISKPHLRALYYRGPPTGKLKNSKRGADGGKEKRSASDSPKRSPMGSPSRSPKQSQNPADNLEVTRHPQNSEAVRNLVPKSFFGMYLSGDVSDPTKLHVAIKEGDLTTVKDILKKEKDMVYTRDKSGRIALHWAVVLGTPKITKLILRNTSWWYLDRCDYNGCTPLHYAAQAGRSDEARRLLKRGAFVNARDLRNRTPLQYAVLVGNTFIIQRLVENKANLWMGDKDAKLPIDLTENPEVIALVRRLMKPNVPWFRMCFPKRVERKGKMDYDDKFPYVHEANKVKRCLPKDMLKDMMTADARRSKHGLEHDEVQHANLK